MEVLTIREGRMISIITTAAEPTKIWVVLENVAMKRTGGIVQQTKYSHGLIMMTNIQEAPKQEREESIKVKAHVAISVLQTGSERIYVID